MSEQLVNALVKLRHRIEGRDAALTQAEAQALYVAVLRHAPANQIADQEYAEQVKSRTDVTAARLGVDPRGVADRQALGWLP